MSSVGAGARVWGVRVIGTGRGRERGVERSLCQPVNRLSRTALAFWLRTFARLLGERGIITPLIHTGEAPEGTRPSSLEDIFME